MTTETRKSDHIDITLNHDVEPNQSSLSDVHLVHRALPELNLADVDISCTFLGRRFDAPLMITGMTGGTAIAETINKNLAIAAAAENIPMGLGSQRAMLENTALVPTYNVKAVAPDVFLFGNLGLVQFTLGYTKKHAQEAVDLIHADGLAIHLNPLQESMQPEGDTNWTGCIEKLAAICAALDKPVLVKEVGEGISGEMARQIEIAGAAAIDISGVGGTSWSLIESYRADSDMGKKFAGWGVSTPVAIVEAHQSVSIPIVASGGIRTGIDVAKALALGATLCGVALPFLKEAAKSSDAVRQKIQALKKEIRAALFLSGAKTIAELQKKPVVITGITKDWLELRGFDVSSYARRP